MFYASRDLLKYKSTELQLFLPCLHCPLITASQVYNVDYPLLYFLHCVFHLSCHTPLHNVQ